MEVLSNIENIWVLKKKHFHEKIALVYLRPIAGQEVRQNHVFLIITIRTERKDAPCSSSNVALKFAIAITIARNKEMRRTMLGTLFAMFLSLSNSVFPMGRLSYRVTHRISGGGSTNENSKFF